MRIKSCDWQKQPVSEMKGRYEAMSIEKKYIQEEIRTKVEESIRRAKEKLAAGLTPEEIIHENKELTADELESVAGGRMLTTGQEITVELVDQMAAVFKAQKVSADELIIMSHDLGFWPEHVSSITLARQRNEHEFAYIDQWATNQKGKVRQTQNGGFKNYLDPYSPG